MSRDEVGRAGPAAGPASDPAPRDRSVRLLDDAAAPAIRGAEREAVADDEPVDGEAPTRRGGAGALLRRGRLLLALLLAVALGAGGALLAVRGRAAADVRLLAVGAFPDYAVGSADEIPVTLLVASLGEQDVTVVGGGTESPRARMVAAVRQTGPLAGAAGDGAAEALEEGTALVPARSAAALVLDVPASCDDLPPWRPWLEVRAGSGSSEVVELEAVDDPFASEGGPLEDLCSSRAVGDGLDDPAVTVVGSRLDGQEIVLDVQDVVDARYRVAVASGGVAGLSLVGGDAEVGPGAVAEVRLAVDPASCAAALAAPDLGADVRLGLERVDDADGPASSDLSLDPYAVGPVVALAVGRACPDA